MSNANEAAFPLIEQRDEPGQRLGLTKREHAAILLRVPRSGDADIDAMIFEANRLDAAAMLYQQFLTGAVLPPGYDASKDFAYAAARAIEAADALLAELERTA